MVGLAVFVGTVYAPLWSLVQLGVEAPFRYLAADAFYYLAIANNSLGRAFFTYDGIHPTNGFNPLWQYYLSLAFATVTSSQAGQLTFAFVSSAVFAGLGLGLFGTALHTLVRRSALVVLSLVPGFYYVLCSPLDPHFGAPWSFVNGMETGLSLLWFGLLSYLVLARGFLTPLTVWRTAATSALITLVVLSRLDDVFLFLPLAALLWIRWPSCPAPAVASVVAAAIPVAAIGGYLAYNYSYSGMLLPISGVAKSYGLTNPVAWINTMREFVAVLVPPRSGASPWTWSGGAWRTAQLAVPVLCAGLLVRIILRGSGPWRDALRGLDDARLWLVLLAALYVPAKAGYNFVYVHLWDQGHWYYPLSIIIANTGLLLVVDGMLRRRQGAGGPLLPRPARAMAVAVAGLLIAAWGNSFVQLKHYSAYGADFYHFWSERTSIAARLDAAGPGGILEFDDGIVAYALPRPTQSGMALAGDRELLASSLTGTILDFAYQRGARYLASVWYIQEWPKTAFSDDDALRTAVQRLSGQRDLSPWTFRLVARHQSKHGQYVIVAFGPAEASWGAK